MEIETVRTPGLGDSTYVLHHEGVAVVVDPQRDIERFETVIDRSGAELRLVLETHLHNDYVSGGHLLASRSGAELVMPAGAAPVFRHRPAFHQEDIDTGSFAIRPLHTPGHTPEHTSYLILVEGSAEAVFTGGSLLHGSSGRTDLLGWKRARSLARLQYGSLQRLSRLPDQTVVCPTHGAGSFCSTVAITGRSTTTIGAEKETNPSLAYEGVDAFEVGQLSGLVPYPSYYAHMAEINLSGSRGQIDLEVPLLGSGAISSMGEEVVVVDGRPVERFAAGHLPESLSIELRRDFGVWVGWVVEFGAPLLLVLDPDQDPSEAVRQLGRIGFDDIRGVVTDLGGWGGSLETNRVADTASFASAVLEGAQILDARAPDEWENGTIEGSEQIYVPDVAKGRLDALDPSQPVWVACASGFRAGITASKLLAEGFEPVVLTGGGVTEVLKWMSDNG